MTKITFFKKDGAFWGFRETGHAGFADSGQDIVCAALSAMTMLVINTLEVALAADVTYDIEEKTTNITVECRAGLPSNSDERQRYAVQGVFCGYYLQLNDMIEDYYDCLDVTAIEKNP